MERNCVKFTYGLDHHAIKAAKFCSFGHGPRSQTESRYFQTEMNAQGEYRMNAR